MGEVREVRRNEVLDGLERVQHNFIVSAVFWLENRCDVIDGWMES